MRLYIFLTLGIIILQAVRLLFSPTTQELVLNALTLTITAALGWMLIRSLSRERQNRERITQLAQDLRVSNEELRNLDQLKSDFVSIVSHQLRSPLAAMKGYLSMALEGMFGPLTVGLQEKLSRIYQSNERLIRLVSDLLDLSRIERGKIEYAFSPVKIKEMLEGLMEELKITVGEEQKLVFRIDIPQNFPVIDGDEEKLRQVFTNLIDNAIHYTTQGEIAVSAELLPGGKLVRMIIKDTGVGITPEDALLIFTKFHRGAESIHIHTNGAGLGLFVARRIVEDHGGRIWVESEGKGKGSVFFVELPVRQENKS